MNINKEIQDLSNVYVTLQDIELKGKYAMPMAMCLNTLEEVINKLNNEMTDVQKEKGDK